MCQKTSAFISILLGYASDFNFLPVALRPHGVGFLKDAGCDD